MKRILISLFAVVVLLAAAGAPAARALAPADKQIGINVVLNTDVTDPLLAELAKYGKVNDVLLQIDAVTMRVYQSKLPAIQALPFVAAASPDSVVKGAPVDTVAATNFTNGFNTWDLDAVNVTEFRQGRVEAFTGQGVYVAVLDTGLLDSWRKYFPQERIAEEYAVAFGGGGGEQGTVSSQPNKWEHDQNSHGTHVTSTILGYSLNGTPINGVAPMATVIPVKVLNQNGSGWSSTIARGIVYVADLKTNELGGAPVVINMSLGGSVLDAVEKAAIDYAVSKGVLIVASAGNNGTSGMGYPGAYEPVISVAAAGFTKQWTAAGWWNALDVADPTNENDFYIADFSSRQLTGQDLDVTAPGALVVGPYQVNSGSSTSFYYLSGTSMSSPHVAGIVALMAQKKPALTQAEAEAILTGAAMVLQPGCRAILASNGTSGEVCWGTDATGSGLITADAALAGTH